MKPQKSINGLTFFPVPEFSGIEESFGADASKYFGRKEIPEIPKEFIDMAKGLFFNGGNLPELNEKVDQKLAIMAVRAWLCSFDPCHESKIATVAYAFWIWSSDEL